MNEILGYLGLGLMLALQELAVASVQLSPVVRQKVR